MNQLITLREVADLVYAAEEVSPRLGRIATQLLSRDRETHHLYRELEMRAQDGGIEIGSSQWSLAAIDLGKQVDRLLNATRASWLHPKEILDPEGVAGVDVEGLIRICRSRLSRQEPQTRRLRQVLEQLVATASAGEAG